MTTDFQVGIDPFLDAAERLEDEHVAVEDRGVGPFAVPQGKGQVAGGERVGHSQSRQARGLDLSPLEPAEPASQNASNQAAAAGWHGQRVAKQAGLWPRHPRQGRGGGGHHQFVDLIVGNEREAQRDGAGIPSWSSSANQDEPDVDIADPDRRRRSGSVADEIASCEARQSPPAEIAEARAAPAPPTGWPGIASRGLGSP